MSVSEFFSDLSIPTACCGLPYGVVSSDAVEYAASDYNNIGIYFYHCWKVNHNGIMTKRHVLHWTAHGQGTAGHLPVFLAGGKEAPAVFSCPHPV